jgi:serine/threonine-protein kinase
MIGEKLGPFQIESKLGSGAMGIVYLARHDASGQPAAVKVVQSESTVRSNTAERFQRESDILKQFRHPNIVRHIGVGYSKARNLSYYAMEYVPGSTLEHVLEQRGAIPWPEVVELGIQICDALQYAHERGVVHRDLKPSNLLVTEQGKLKLTDFGIAKDLDRTALTATGRTLGTAAYMSPEQIRGTPEVSHKTDLYALGCVLYQMVVGELAFEGKSAVVLMHKHLDETPPRPSARQPDIPLALDKLIFALMAKNRDDRPWDAAAARQVLVELREKLQRKEPVRKVFGEVEGIHPARLGSVAPMPPESAAAEQPTRGATKVRKKTRARSTPEQPEPSIPTLRGWIETGLLVLGLVAGGGVLGYLLWPPSAAYLHRKAAEGMAGKSRGEWVLAREYYMDELDRRFPDHPYADDLRKWRDQILLSQTESRAAVLESPRLAPLAGPEKEVEKAYQKVFHAVAEDLREGHDDTALGRWRALAEALKGVGEEERGWYLMAERRARELAVEIAARREAAAALLLRAETLGRAGRAADAARLRAEALEQYGKFHSLDDLLGPLRVAPAPATKPSRPPEP